ncbi:MAG: azurin [Planctomycetota bacterium]|nr:MAG: azurin [Planctomycetota bacterium]REK20685.1 MAG: azurin [Planctomycetota bacterium]REK38133.1 MAG: azurin [Planctomycetota bacterium]
MFLRFALCAALCWGFLTSPVAAQSLALDLEPDSKIVLIGNTHAERMQYFGGWETLLHARFPEHNLVVRNLGFSGDTINVRLRSLNFQDHGHTLVDHEPDVILAFFGFNESFAGPEGLERFKTDLATFLTELKQLHYPSTTFARGSSDPVSQDKSAENVEQPKIVLVSPIANEDLPERGILAATWNNENLALYTEAMQEVAEDALVGFVNLYTPTLEAPADARPYTTNGVHISREGEARIGALLDELLFGPQPDRFYDEQFLAPIHREVNEKNLQFFYDYRAVNGYYIYGDRKEPFGVVNFPAEFAKLREMIKVRDNRVWAAARGEDLPEAIDDGDTGEFTRIETNFQNEVYITPPEEAQQQFTSPEGFQVELFASEVEFPDLENPVQFAFDAKGRLYVTTMPSYPMYLPGTPVDDKILILEDTDHDGRADKQTVFADGLHLPGGIELGDGGAYVAQQPNLVFLQDSDGDDQADAFEYRLHGFDSADSHHALGAFEWGPGGDLYFAEGTFHHTQVETPYGLTRVKNAAVFRYEPRSEKFGVFVSYEFANPWGICWDDWGQTFVADASGGANYFAAAFSGEVDYPRKHPGLKQFLVKQWRPTCGCEIVSSRNFPEVMQGDYLLNNCIGFQGVLQYRFKEDGSGFAADPVEPLLRSSDPNFRPVDLQFGPDGALYVLDWFNPLIGHMQHNIRDPKRDQHHGRIWRISYTKKPLVDPPAIAGESIEHLLDQLKTYEYRTRYRVRRELRDRNTDDVVTAVDNWVAGLREGEPNYEHHRLEALWVKQHHGAVDPSLLEAVLNSPDRNARAAAVRVLCYWRDEVDDPLALLQKRVNDEDPRVRLEAVRALSFFDSEEALAIAVESLIYEQDDYLEYVFNETTATLQERIDAAAE